MLCLKRLCPENCPRGNLPPPLVSVRVWFTISVRIRAGGNFPRGKLSQNRKRHFKGGKPIAPMDFKNILENQTFQRIAKFIMADFYKMDFIKGNVISVYRRNVQYLEVYQPLFFGREMIWKWMMKVLFAADMPIRLLCLSFNKGQT